MRINTGGAGNYEISTNGTLVYLPASSAWLGDMALSWIDRNGSRTQLPGPARVYLDPRLSPDGRRLAVRVLGASNDIYVHDLERRTFSRLTSEGNNRAPLFTPDGRRIVFSSARGLAALEVGAMKGNLWWMPADGSGQAERLTTSDHVQVLSSWSPDGKTLAFVETAPDSGADILLLTLDGERRTRSFLRTRFNETARLLARREVARVRVR